MGVQKLQINEILYFDITSNLNPYLIAKSLPPSPQDLNYLYSIIPSIIFPKFALEFYQITD